MAYQIQVPYPTGKENYYPPYAAQTVMTAGQQLDVSLQQLAKQTEETNLYGAYLVASNKNCEEHEKLLNQQITNINKQTENLHKDRVKLAKSLSPVIALADKENPDIIKIIGAALIAGILVGGVCWIIAKNNMEPTRHCRYC